MPPASAFRRDRVTWIAYAMLAFFAYLQASPGVVIPHLRSELHLSYTAGGLHLAAFAGASALAGFTSGPLERRIGRRALFWLGVAGMAASAALLTVVRVEALTITAMGLMGAFGGTLLVTVQAVLADHHGEARAVAFAESNVAASVAYVLLIGAMALAAALALGWRAALIAALVVPPVAFALSRNGPPAAPAPPRSGDDGPEPRIPVAFWIAAGMLFCTTAAEWCLTAWGASFVEDAAAISVDTAVTLMAGYYGGVVIGRVGGSALTRRRPVAQLLAVALAIAAAGFAVLWPAHSPAVALVGLTLAGVGIGNLFPLGLSLAVSIAPERAQVASARLVAVTASAVLLAPLTVGTLADAASLTAAFAVVPVCLALAAAGLAGVATAQRRRRSSRSSPAPLPLSKPSEP